MEERGELSKRIDDLHKRFDDANRRTDDLRAEMLGRFDLMNQSVNQRFDDVNRRFDDLNQRFTTLMWVIISYFSFLTLLTVVFKFLRV